MPNVEVSDPSVVVVERNTRFHEEEIATVLETEPRVSVMAAGLALCTKKLKQHRYDPGTDTD